MNVKLAIMFGGASFEHEISIVSAITVKEKLKGLELSFIFCDQDHRFYMIDPAQMKAITFSKGAHKKMPQLSMTNGGFEQKTLFGAKRYDMPVLNLIHGGDGEDGSIAAMLEIFMKFRLSVRAKKLPCSVLTSTIRNGLHNR